MPDFEYQVSIGEVIISPTHIVITQVKLKGPDGEPLQSWQRLGQDEPNNWQHILCSNEEMGLIVFDMFLDRARWHEHVDEQATARETDPSLYDMPNQIPF